MFRYLTSYCSRLHSAVSGKIQTGEEGAVEEIIFDKTTGNLGLLLYPKKFQTKWSIITPGISGLLHYPKKFQTKWSIITPGVSATCVTSFGNSEAYIQDLWKLNSKVYIPFLGHWNFHIFFRYSMPSVTSPHLYVFLLKQLIRTVTLTVKFPVVNILMSG